MSLFLELYQEQFFTDVRNGRSSTLLLLDKGFPTPPLQPNYGRDRFSIMIRGEILW